jgi:hypothetical protein
MKAPSELTREQLENIVGQIRDILWLDPLTNAFDLDCSGDSERIDQSLEARHPGRRRGSQLAIIVLHQSASRRTARPDRQPGPCRDRRRNDPPSVRPVARPH